MCKVPGQLKKQEHQILEKNKCTGIRPAEPLDSKDTKMPDEGQDQDKQNGYAVDFDQGNHGREVSRTELLTYIKEDGMRLIEFDSTVKNDFELVHTAVKETGFALIWASDSLKDNESIVTAAVINSGCAIEYASTRLRDNKDVVLEAVKSNGLAIQFASDAMKEDLDVVEAALANDADAQRFCKSRKEGILNKAQRFYIAESDGEPKANTEWFSLVRCSECHEFEGEETADHFDCEECLGTFCVICRAKSDCSKCGLSMCRQCKILHKCRRESGEGKYRQEGQLNPTCVVPPAATAIVPALAPSGSEQVRKRLRRKTKIEDNGIDEVQAKRLKTNLDDPEDGMSVACEAELNDVTGESQLMQDMSNSSCKNLRSEWGKLVAKAGVHNPMAKGHMPKRIEKAQLQGRCGNAHDTHQLMILSTSKCAILFCRCCSQFAQQRCVGIKAPCKGKPTDGLTNLRRKRMILGYHPLDQGAKV